MQIIVGMALGIFVALIVAGFPIAYMVASRMGQEIYLRFPFLLAASLLFGFSFLVPLGDLFFVLLSIL